MINIWEKLKNGNDLDLVLIQMGWYIRAWNEDADKMSELFNLNIANTKKDGTGNNYTGFYTRNIDKYEDQIKKLKLSYVILTLDEFISDDGETFFRRVVTKSSISDLIGRSFINDRPKKKSNKKIKDVDSEFYFLNAILHGVFAHTGEKIEKSSPWMHPQILEDIEDFMTFEKEKTLNKT